jgi:ribosome maturation factor RimP
MINAQYIGQIIKKVLQTLAIYAIIISLVTAEAVMSGFFPLFLLNKKFLEEYGNRCCMSKIVEIVTEFVRPIVEQNGCELWDVEYVSEGGQWYLRVYIDKSDGVSIDDCERISRAIDPILDEKDPITNSYTFEVSSAGLERTLKQPAHFQRFLGENVEVKLYKPVDGSKLYTGILSAYDNGSVTLDRNGESVTFSKEQIANVRLRLA